MYVLRTKSTIKGSLNDYIKESTHMIKAHLNTNDFWEPQNLRPGIQFYYIKVSKGTFTVIFCPV